MVSKLYGKHVDQMIKTFGTEYDGFMFIDVSFELEPTNLSIGGNGAAAVYAYFTLKLWKNDGKKAFIIRERAVSKKKIGMVGGIPIMSVEKLLPLCEKASDALIKDLKDNLPKLVKKAAKKF